MYILITSKIIDSKKSKNIDELIIKKLYRINEILEEDITYKFNYFKKIIYKVYFILIKEFLKI